MDNEQSPDSSTLKAVTSDAVTPHDLMRIARGFTAVFWGMLLGLLLFSNAVSLHWNRVPIPSYTLGVVLVFIGMLTLHTVTPFTRSWRKHVRTSLFVLLLHIYFAPFVYWWHRMPDVSYFLLNVMTLLFCSVWLLLLLNQLVLELSHTLDNDSLRLEAELCGWSVVILLLIPYVFFVVYPLLAAMRHHSSVFVELVQLMQRLPRWVLVFSLLPFTLTLAVCWKTKEHCFRTLQKSPGSTDRKA
jgi:hypothetical protein